MLNKMKKYYINYYNKNININNFFLKKEKKKKG